MPTKKIKRADAVSESTELETISKKAVKQGKKSISIEACKS
jgi:hypothetical protein